MAPDQVNAEAIGVMANTPRFDHVVNNLNVFKAQLQQFFVVNLVTDKLTKEALLLTALSENTYILLINLLNPVLPDAASETSEHCLTVLEEHFKPSKASFMERHTFYRAVKQPSETIHDWEARVKALAVNCEFGSFLDTALLDKFVMGLEKGPAREKVFLEGVNIQLKRAVENAAATEYIQSKVKNDEVIDHCLHIGRGTTCDRRYQQQQQRLQVNHQQQQQKLNDDNQQQRRQQKEK